MCDFQSRYEVLIGEHQARIAAFSIDGLSAREREVFLLLGLGLSNPDLVKHLQVTERTVKAHVSRILAKLGLPRAKVAVVAALYITEMCTSVHVRSGA